MYVRMYVSSVDVGLLSFSLSLSHSQRPEGRNSLLLLASPANVSNYLFTVVMFCTNQHGLSTEMSTSNSLKGSECVILEPPPPSPTSTLPTISPTTSSTSSGAPSSATVEPCKLLQWLVRTYISAFMGKVHTWEISWNACNSCPCLFLLVCELWRWSLVVAFTSLSVILVQCSRLARLISSTYIYSQLIWSVVALARALKR